MDSDKPTSDRTLVQQIAILTGMYIGQSVLATSEDPYRSYADGADMQVCSIAALQLQQNSAVAALMIIVGATTDNFDSSTFIRRNSQWVAKNTIILQPITMTKSYHDEELRF